MQTTNLQDEPIETEVYYLERDPKHEHEKPYLLNYDAEGVIPRTNTVNEPKTVLVHNFRNLRSSCNLKEHGFTLIKLPAGLDAIDFDDERMVRELYYPAALKILRQFFPSAAKYEILGHQVKVNQKSLYMRFYRMR
jgi:hypothetical protein